VVDAVAMRATWRILTLLVTGRITFVGAVMQGSTRRWPPTTPRASFARAEHILPSRQKLAAWSVLQTRRPRMMAEYAHVLLASTVPAAMSA
jgi:hypothetical protein